MSRLLALSLFLVLGVSHARIDGLNMTKWVNSQKQSLMKMVQQHDAATAGRLLASWPDGGVAWCGGGFFRAMMMANMLSFAEMSGTKEKMCASHRRMKACKGKAAAACNSGCEWSKVECSPPGGMQPAGSNAARPSSCYKEECGPLALGVIGDIVNPDAGSLFAAVVAVAKTCNAKIESSCTDTCEWNAWNKKCDIGGSFWWEDDDAVCKRSAWNSIIDETSKCTAIGVAADCTGKCEYKHEYKQCDLSDAEFAKLVYGSTAGAAFMDKLKTQMACTADRETCAAAGCKKFVEGCAAGISDWTVTTMSKEFTCAKKTEATCTGECEWKHDHRRLTSHDGSWHPEDRPPHAEDRPPMQEGGPRHADGSCHLSEAFLQCGDVGTETGGAISLGSFAPLLFALTVLLGQF